MATSAGKRRRGKKANLDYFLAESHSLGYHGKAETYWIIREITINPIKFAERHLICLFFNSMVPKIAKIIDPTKTTNHIKAAQHRSLLKSEMQQQQQLSVSLQLSK